MYFLDKNLSHFANIFPYSLSVIEISKSQLVGFITCITLSPFILWNNWFGLIFLWKMENYNAFCSFFEKLLNFIVRASFGFTISCTEKSHWPLHRKNSTLQIIKNLIYCWNQLNNYKTHFDMGTIIEKREKSTKWPFNKQNLVPERVQKWKIIKKDCIFY